MIHCVCCFDSACYRWSLPGCLLQFLRNEKEWSSIHDMYKILQSSITTQINRLGLLTLLIEFQENRDLPVSTRATCRFSDEPSATVRNSKGNTAAHLWHKILIYSIRPNIFQDPRGSCYSYCHPMPSLLNSLMTNCALGIIVFYPTFKLLIAGDWPPQWTIIQTLSTM